MRESMARLTPRFSTNRAVREYTEQYYFRRPQPTVSGLPTRRNRRDMVNWRTLSSKMDRAALREVKVETDREQQYSEVQVYLDDLDPEAVRVELYANGLTVLNRSEWR